MGKNQAGWWWQMPYVPALGKQRQAAHGAWSTELVPGQPGLHTKKSCLKKKQNKTKEKNQCLLWLGNFFPSYLLDLFLNHKASLFRCQDLISVSTRCPADPWCLLQVSLVKGGASAAAGSLQREWHNHSSCPWGCGCCSTENRWAVSILLWPSVHLLLRNGCEQCKPWLILFFFQYFELWTHVSQHWLVPF